MVKITAAEARERLVDGNARFVADLRAGSSESSSAPRYRLVAEQRPFAIIVGCSDARVPAEIVFDQGLGELFVIRIAGNVIAPSQIGSVEFAAERFGAPLVVVLGHTGCGAVEATLQELERPSEGRSPNLHAIVDRIRPALEPLLETGLRDDPAALMAAAVRANIRASTRQLRHGSQILERLIDDGRLEIMGAEYSLATGEVEFLDPGGKP